MPDATVLSLLKAAAPLTVGTELAALLSGKLNGAAAFKAAAERLGRLAAVLAAVTAATQRAPSSSSSSYFLLSSSAPFRAAAAAALAQWHTACFHWTGAAYVALRAAGSRATSAASKGKVPAHLTLWAIFTCCAAHNWLMVHRADLMSPYYVKLWLRVIPGYRTLEAYIEHFGAPATTGTANYPPAQVKSSRVAKIPRDLFKAFRAQLPFVAGLQVALPTATSLAKARRYCWSAQMMPSSIGSVTSGILGGRKTLTKLSSAAAAAAYVSELVVRSLRSSAVLAVLPFLLTEPPAIWAAVQRKVLGHRHLRSFGGDATAAGEEGGSGGGSSGGGTSGDVSSGGEEGVYPPTPRAPWLHAAVTAALSTGIFMVEPPARREIIVVYTWWRVVEAMLASMGLKIAEDHTGGGNAGSSKTGTKNGRSPEELAAAALIGAAAACC